MNKETLELARILREVETLVFDRGEVEDPDETLPPRKLTWSFIQKTVGISAPPVTYLCVQLTLVAQSPGNADEALVDQVTKALGQDRFCVDPLEPCETDAQLRLQALRTMLQQSRESGLRLQGQIERLSKELRRNPGLDKAAVKES